MIGYILRKIINLSFPYIWPWGVLSKFNILVKHSNLMMIYCQYYHQFKSYLIIFWYNKKTLHQKEPYLQKIMYLSSDLSWWGWYKIQIINKNLEKVYHLIQVTGGGLKYEEKNQSVFVKHYAPGANRVWKSYFSMKVKVKVTRSLILTFVSFERASLVEYIYMPNMKPLSLIVLKL